MFETWYDVYLKNVHLVMLCQTYNSVYGPDFRSQNNTYHIIVQEATIMLD